MGSSPFLLLQGFRHDVSYAAYTLSIGMYAVFLHLVSIVGKKSVEVNQLEAILLSHFLLDGDNLVGDDGIADVPRRLEGWNGRAEVNLGPEGLLFLALLPRKWKRNSVK